MEDFFDMDHARALVYLGAATDNKNKVLISDDQICIIYRNRKNVLPLASIRQLRTGHKKMLLPLILGGIITPFAFLSYFVNMFHPWIHLISVLIGLLLFYLGWNGRSAFILVFRNGDELLHYLPSISKNLDAFINYVNEYVKTSASHESANSIIVEIDPEEESALFGEENRNIQNMFPIIGFTPAQYTRLKKQEKKKHSLTFDPLGSGREIRFKYDEASSQMRPLIDGPIKRSSIIGRINNQ